MPAYPYSDNMYSGLDDSDVEEQPRVDGGGNRNTHGYEYGTDLGAVAGGAGAGAVSGVGGTDVGVDPRHQRAQHVADHDEEQVLSPTDGYFGRSGDNSSSDYDTAYPISDNYPESHPLSPSHQSSSVDVHVRATPSSHYPAAASSQVPHVPNVWVNDPSLEQGSTAESKAREAQEERELNRRRAGRPHPSNLASLPHAAGEGGSSPFPSLNTTSTPSTTYGPGQSRYAYGPGLSYAPSSQRYTPSSSSAAAPSRSQRSGTIYSERSSLFSEAPPAYTPSPTSTTSPPSNYQTIRPSNMGRISESESRGLLASHEYESIPQDMGGQPDDDYTYTRTGNWRDRVRSRVASVNGRTCKLVALGVVLLLVTIGFLVSSFIGVRDEVSTYISLSVAALPITP